MSKDTSSSGIIDIEDTTPTTTTTTTTKPVPPVIPIQPPIKTVINQPVTSEELQKKLDQELRNKLFNDAAQEQYIIKIRTEIQGFKYKAPEEFKDVPYLNDTVIEYQNQPKKGDRINAHEGEKEIII